MMQEHPWAEREAEKQRAPKKRQDSQINKVFPLQIAKKEDLKKNNYVLHKVLPRSNLISQQVLVLKFFFFTPHGVWKSQKSIIQHFEQSELRLHFELTKVY